MWHTVRVAGISRGGVAGGVTGGVTGGATGGVTAGCAYFVAAVASTHPTMPTNSGVYATDD